MDSEVLLRLLPRKYKYKISYANIQAKSDVLEEQDMPDICPRYGQDMPEIYPRYTQDMPEICPRYNQDITKI